MKKQIKSVISLFAICAVIAIILALTNALTAPTIQKNEEAAANAALLDVLPTGEDFQKVDLSAHQNIPATVKEAYSEKNGGYVFKLETTGYSAGMIIMCGVNADGTVSGAICLSSGETLGYEKTYGDMLKGKDASTVDTVNTTSGATKTTSAYRAAVKDALNAFINLNGGNADIRTEEEILADNLAAALPSAEGKFTLGFITEELSGVNELYVAENGSGFVYVCGESFVGVDANGAIVSSDISSDLKATVEGAVAKMAASKLTAIDLTQYQDLPTSVYEASKTDSGNFILSLKAMGYGIHGSWEASGEPIKLKVVITPEGKLITCQTIYQNETDGVGSVCAEPKFYNQFEGKTQNECNAVDTVSGATVTTSGYRAAVLEAFTAVEILKGGN